MMKNEEKIAKKRMDKFEKDYRNMNDLDKEQVDYLVSYYNKFKFVDKELNVLHHITVFKIEEQAKSFAASQQKHYEGVELIVVKRTSKLELI